MEMTMGIGDRLEMLNFLPREGDYIQQTIVRDIGKKVELSQEDIQKGDVKVQGNGFFFLPENDFEIEVEFTKPEKEVLVERYNELNRTQKITPQNYDLCTKVKNMKDEETKTE